MAFANNSASGQLCLMQTLKSNNKICLLELIQDAVSRGTSLVRNVSPNSYTDRKYLLQINLKDFVLFLHVFKVCLSPCQVLAMHVFAETTLFQIKRENFIHPNQEQTKCLPRASLKVTLAANRSSTHKPQPVMMEQHEYVGPNRALSLCPRQMLMFILEDFSKPGPLVNFFHTFFLLNFISQIANTVLHKSLNQTINSFRNQRVKQTCNLFNIFHQTHFHT